MESAPNDARDRRGRRLAITTGIVFFISLAFPVVVGVSNNTAAFPRLWGILDVVIAFILAALAIVIASLFDQRVDDQIRQDAYRSYRALINVVLILLVVFLLGGDRIKWTIFLPGLAWRAWLLFYCLPAWLAALREKPAVPRAPTPETHD
jgi:MFS family permease